MILLCVLVTGDDALAKGWFSKLKKKKHVLFILSSVLSIAQRDLQYMFSRCLNWFTDDDVFSTSHINILWQQYREAEKSWCLEGRQNSGWILILTLINWVTLNRPLHWASTSLPAKDFFYDHIVKPGFQKCSDIVVRECFLKNEWEKRQIKKW